VNGLFGKGDLKVLDVSHKAKGFNGDKTNAGTNDGGRSQTSPNQSHKKFPSGTKPKRESMQLFSSNGCFVFR
jgi:hypothetical protein